MEPTLPSISTTATAPPGDPPPAGGHIPQPSILTSCLTPQPVPLVPLVPLATTPTPPRITTSPRPPSPHVPMWDCIVCDRSIQLRVMEKHLAGKPHQKQQLLWERNHPEQTQAGPSSAQPAMVARLPEKGRRVARAAPRVEANAAGSINHEEQRRKTELFFSQLDNRRKEKIKKEADEAQEVRSRSHERGGEEIRRKQAAQARSRERRVVEQEIRKKKEEELRNIEQKRVVEEMERREAEELKRSVEEEIQRKEAEEVQRSIREEIMCKEQEEAEQLQRRLEQETQRQEAEELEKQKQQKEEREQAERLAEQKRIHEENLRREEEKKREQEEIDRLARQQEAVIRKAELDSKVAHKQRSSGRLTYGVAGFVPASSSIGQAAMPQGGEASEQNSGSRAGERAGYKEKILLYLKLQEMLEEEDEEEEEEEEGTADVEAPGEIYHEQVQAVLDPGNIETLPMLVTSVTDLPPILYRVYDDTSISKYTWKGFASGGRRMPRNASQFKAMVQHHGNWTSRKRTPFVSVTASPDAASWHIVKKKATGDDTNIMVALIDTVALLGPCQTSVWKMHDAMDHFGLEPWKGDRHAYDNEYICALAIPAKAVFACCQPEFFMDTALAFLKSLELREGGNARQQQNVYVRI